MNVAGNDKIKHKENDKKNKARQSISIKVSEAAEASGENKHPHGKRAVAATQAEGDEQDGGEEGGWKWLKKTIKFNYR